MPRPQKNRIVQHPPLFTEFKPVGYARKHLDKTVLSLDEFEAFRLSDYQGMSHEEAAEEMEISRSTFSRLIETTRKKIADALIQGQVLSIAGGNVHFRKNIIRCHDCGNIFHINMDAIMLICPKCHSENIINLAGGFGHGKCCT